MSKVNHRLKNVLKSRRAYMHLNHYETENNNKLSKKTPYWWSHDFLKIGFSPLKGRYVYTIKDILKSQVLFKEEPLKAKSRKQLNLLIQNDERCLELDGGYEGCLDKNTFYSDMYELFFMGSMFSHSCDPNVRLKNDAFIAIKDIKAGEEVTISYLNRKLTNMSNEKRNSNLKHWFDKCSCHFCKKGAPPLKPR